MLTAIIKKDEEMFVAECAEVGTTSQGRSIKEAVSNLQEPQGAKERGLHHHIPNFLIISAQKKD